mmetsp:Transcript_23105/g.54820  ORF Transcript_23105/g.54820 Transcript_23105/m.54820 type:complete len:523 (+) Transcript_23105:78-1646(+)
MVTMAEGEKDKRMSAGRDITINGGDDKTTNEDLSKQELVSPFITTSDIVNNLNKQLAMLSDGAPGEGEGSTSTTTTSIGSTGPLEALSSLRQKPRFELNKRLPDGSAVPATTEEISAADFKTKLEQAASFVSQLATPRDRQYWAEQQRLLGNRYFESGDYKAAMDVYLTCLLVKENTPDFVQVTLFPVLNNLAQCTLQLGMYKKTIAFCSIAIEEMGKIHNKSNNNKTAGEEVVFSEVTATVNDMFVAARNNNNNMDGKTTKKNDEKEHQSSSPNNNATAVIDALALCKIYFKKAKAERLSGLYEESRQDLNYSLDFLEQKGHEVKSSSSTVATAATAATTTNSSSDRVVDEDNNRPNEENNDDISLEPYHRAIQKEYRSLDIAEKEARKNRQRQKRAMQKVLSSSETKIQSKNDDSNSSNKSSPLLYGDRISFSSSMSGGGGPSSESRQFSTLRARRVTNNKTTTFSTNTSSNEDDNYSYQHVIRYYWDMVARVTQSLLIILGDDEVEEDGDNKNMDKKQR